MSILLEVLGRGVTVDTSRLIVDYLKLLHRGENLKQAVRWGMLERVVKLLDEEKISSAREQLRLYLFEFPSCARGRLAAGAISLHENQLAEAIGELNSVYVRQPGNTMALYALGHCYERLGRETQAVEFYQDCLKFKNYFRLPRQRLAAICYKNGQMQKTIREYELLRQEYPDDISTLLTLGHLYRIEGAYDKAIEAFNTAILIHPDNFRGVDERAEGLIRNGELDEALKYVDGLLEQHAEKADLLLMRADILRQLGMVEQATQTYEQAVQLCPDFLEAAVKLATQYLQQSDEKSAARQFNQAVEINDRIVDAYLGLALSQGAAGSTAEALSTLSLAAAVQANSSVLFAEAAKLEFVSSQYEATGPASRPRANQPDLLKSVIAAYRGQLADRPENAELLYGLGLLLLERGKLAQARKLFGRALRIHPTYTRAKYKLVLCLHDGGSPQQALACLMHTEALDKATVQLHYRTALLYCDRVKFASALLNLQRLTEDNLTTGDAHIDVSIALQNLGLLNRAANTCEQTLSAGTHPTAG